MYRIYCDDKTLHDVRDEEYQLITPKISLELNKTGSFEFGILPSPVSYTHLTLPTN